MDVAIPNNCSDLHTLVNWLRKHMPHEMHRLDRWQLVNRPDAYYIWFRNPADATMFGLLWI